jgi:hypothetical protein
MLTLPNPSAQGVRIEYPLLDYVVVSPLFVYGAIATFFFMSANDQYVVGYSVWIPVMLFVVHRTTVALKYATLSPTEYDRFNTCKDQKIVNSYMDQMQLFSGWRCLSDLVLYFELSAASSRIGVKINQIYLRFSARLDDPSAVSQFRYWNAFMRGQDVIDVDSPPAREFIKLANGDYGVSVFDVCIAIIRRANKVDSHSSTVTTAVNVTTVLLVLIIVLPAVLQHQRIERPVLVSFYLLFAGRLVWIFGRIFFGFMYLAFLDVGRYCTMVKTLHCMIRLTDVMMHTSISLASSTTTTVCNAPLTSERLDTIISIAKTHYDNLGDKKVSTLNYFDLEKEEQAEQNEDSQARALLNPTGNFGLINTESNDRAVIGERFAANLSFAVVPRVDLQFAENSIAWIYARLAIQNFGERFRYRTDIYIGKYFFIASLQLIMTMG